MKLTLVDIIPRIKRMLKEQRLINTTIWLSIAAGLIEGVALCLLLPCVTALANNEPVWGLGVWGWVIVLSILAVVSAIVGYVQSLRGYQTALDFLVNVHKKVGDQVSSLPLGWFNRPLAGLLSRLVANELVMTGEIIAHMLSPIIQRVTASIVLLIFAWTWDWHLGLACTISIPVFLLLVLCTTGLINKGKSIGEPTEVELSNRLVEFTHCQAALRSCGRSTHYSKLDDANATWLKAKRRKLWYEIAGNLLGGAFTQVVIVTLISLAANLAVGGTLEPVATIAFIGLCLRFTHTLVGITETAASLEERRSALDSIDDVLTAQPLPEPTESTAQPTPGTIDFEDVHFGYGKEKPVLRGVSFHVPNRSMVALVGPSGCGKTTVARLVSRFYDVDSGAVKVGGLDVREQTTVTLMKSLSMVFQDVYLFDDALEANIRIGNPDASEEEVHEAARLAGVTEIVQRLPHGWKTSVGEGGRALSGGERQRVSIARALLKKAPIVLLDEATSALDPENETNIVAAVDKLRENATVLVIAHKLDTIRKADTIVQFRADGTIEDTGTHSELFERGGTYRAFWDTRAAAQGWQLT
ncbi:ABC transporter ATP-binding protein [Corynebacterium durum]|uniref:ABC transporter ATP-binding protein n=1 Tax=Corynebacterium durum TaxID=61592 RepID=UPI0028E5530D|nr:ABC transporter ATP-binding protein [Corynebacterium durum]